MSVISLDLETEKKLVAAAQDNPEKFEPLYVHYQPHIERFVMAKLGHKEIAEDLTAQVFEKALKNIHTFTWQGTSFSSWLYQIAKRLIIDYLRQQKRRNTHNLAEDVQIAATGKPMETEIEDELLHRLIKEVLNELPEREREAIFLKFYRGYTNKLIAQQTGISETNVGTILYRVVQKLRQELN
jgi:RNA polymerase sigma-70 factor (ECF subfamily)